MFLHVNYLYDGIKRGTNIVEKSMNNGRIENSFIDETFTINIKIYSETFNMLWLSMEVMVMIVYGNDTAWHQQGRIELYYFMILLGNTVYNFFNSIYI